MIRPNGFFSDLEEIYNMAKSGRAYVFGKGEVKMNPIHGHDLAKFCLASVTHSEQDLDVGGPEVLSAKDMALLAFAAQDKRAKISYLPDIVRRFCLSVMKRLPEKWGGPAKFFLTAMAIDAVAPLYGEHHLKDHFDSLSLKKDPLG